MPNTLKAVVFGVLTLILIGCNTEQTETTTPTGTAGYTKQETYITMRDGIRLFTTIYTPKDTTKTYPVLLKRTPYSSRPYGADTLPPRLMHNKKLVESGYIFVVQDVRGRWMSEGVFENTKPPYSLSDSTQTDELTDSWDTFEWFTDSLPHFNGNAGMYGNSYPGWTTLVGARSKHPALKAVMAMAPVTNFYFEDFNRYGLFALNYLPILNAFGTPKNKPSDTAWWVDRSETIGFDELNSTQPDYYDFFLNRFTLNNYGDILDSNDFFWKNIKAHPNYDAYRKERDWVQYLNDITCQVMVVGGWNDEQNLYGILNAYKHIAANSPEANAQFVMGPWSHGHPTRGDSAYYLGDVFYGYQLSEQFMNEVEFPYFEYHLKGKGTAPDFSVKLFDTGQNEWEYFNEFPDQSTRELALYLYDDSLNMAYPEISRVNDYATYVSDPFHPVPYLEGDEFHMMAPKSYFTADQRFVSKRPDVLTFTTEPLEREITALGEIKAYLDFGTNRTGADLYVKIIDVYPENRSPKETDPEGVKMNNYQQLVRLGYIRGRYRNGFESGEPFIPNQKTAVEVPLLDVYHTFKPGHRIMIQIQSSLFPLFDLNPQNYVEDIYQAEKSDFAIALHRIYATSKIIIPVKD